jgi:putative MATE family efflux protein
MQRDNYSFLTTAPVDKVIRTMALPTIISMLVTSIYNIVDTWYVGQLNTQATAAVGVVFPLMAVIQAVGFFFGQGSGTYISRRLGAKDVMSARVMASTAFFACLLFGVAITVICLLLLSPLSVALGSTPTILPYTKDYLGVILLGAPFMACSMTLNNQMRFQGNAANAMYGMMTGAVLNVVLVPIFMFVFHMGILGCGIGTVLSQIFAFLVLLWMSFRGQNVHLSVRRISWRKGDYAFEIFKGGTPSLTRQGLASISTLLLNVAAGVYGDAAIAGMSIVTRIAFVVFAIIIGIGQGFQPLCGFNYGARLYDRVRRGYFYGIKLSMMVLAFFFIVCMVWAEQLIDLLRHDDAVIAVGAVALRWQALTFPLAAVITMSNMMLQTSGKSVAANIVASSRNGLFFIPLILLLPHLFGLFGVEICQAIADFLAFCLTLPFVYQYFRKLGK